MAEFPEFDASIGLAGPTSTRRATAEDFGGRGEGLIQGGVAVQKFAAQLTERKERADITRVQTLRSNAVSEITKFTVDAESAADAGAPGHIENVGAFIDDYYEKLTPQATTQAGKLLLARQAAEVKSAFTVAAIKFQSVSMGVQARDNFEVSVDVDVNTISTSTDPLAAYNALLGPQLDKIGDERGALHKGLNAEDREGLSTDVRESYADALVRGFIRLDPARALHELIGGRFDQVLSKEDKESLMSAAQQGVDGVEAARKAAIAADKAAQAAAVQEEQGVVFNMIHTGVGPDGEAMTPKAVMSYILTNTTLLPFQGAGNKNQLIDVLTLRAKGVTTGEMDATVKEEHLRALAVMYTGVDAEGNQVSLATLRDQLLDEDGAFSELSAATISTITASIDARLAFAEGDQTKGEIEAAHRELYAIAISGGADGEPVSTADFRVLLLSDKFRVLSGATKTALLKLKEAGDAPKAAATVKAAHLNALTIILTGKDLEGKAVSATELEAQMLQSDGPFKSLSAPVIAAILKIGEGVSAPSAANIAAQRNVLTTILTGVDPEGQSLTDVQIMRYINSQTDLPPSGTGSIKSYLSMARDIVSKRKAHTASATANDLYRRLHLPVDDADHLPASAFVTGRIVRAIGFREAASLRDSALALLDPAAKALEIEMLGVFTRFSSSISDATLFKADNAGDELNEAFRQEVRRLVKAKIDAGEDPMVLFDDRYDNKEYVGLLVPKYIRSAEEQRKAASNRARDKSPEIYTSRPDATIEDYWERVEK
jgi:hypothetical protein